MHPVPQARWPAPQPAVSGGGVKMSIVSVDTLVVSVASVASIGRTTSIGTIASRTSPASRGASTSMRDDPPSVVGMVMVTTGTHSPSGPHASPRSSQRSCCVHGEA
jgi:hypothetical protein